MALQYGMNFLASDMRNILEQHRDVQNGVRTWRKLFGNASLGNQAQVDALKADYTDTITQAYKSNLAQRNAILGAGLSAGSTDALLEANRQNLRNTYKQYIGSYNSDMAALNQNYQQEVGEIRDALDERAKNFSDLYSSAYKYLADRLSGASLSRDDMTKPLYDENGNFTGYEQNSINYLDAAKLDWLKDAEGNLLSWNQIANSLIDSNGAVTEKGREFFDKIFNAMPQGYLDEEGKKVVGFDEWLSKENSKLRDWMVSEDNFSDNAAGANLGTAKSIIGMDPLDFSGENFEYLKEKDLDVLRNNALVYLGTLSGENVFAETNKILADYEDMQNRLSAYGTHVSNATERDPLIGRQKNKVNRARKEANKAWASYKEEMDELHSDFLEQLKYTLGSTKYNQFMENNSAVSEYNRMMDAARKSTKYTKSMYDSLKKAYSDLVNSAMSYGYESIGKKYDTQQVAKNDYESLLKHLGTSK